MGKGNLNCLDHATSARLLSDNGYIPDGAVLYGWLQIMQFWPGIKTEATMRRVARRVSLPVQKLGARGVVLIYRDYVRWLDQRCVLK